MTKNSYKTGPDELGYYGEGNTAMGGMAVGETLMPALHELNQGFEEAIKDKEFVILCDPVWFRCSCLNKIRAPPNSLVKFSAKYSGDGLPM